MRRSFLSALIACGVLAGSLDAQERARARDLGIRIGQLTVGRWNAITDVKGVRVGHTTLISDEGGHTVRTGVTAILPRDDVWVKRVFVATFVLNGNGQLTGMPWLEESELLGFPILLTNSASVGQVYDALWKTEPLSCLDEAEEIGARMEVRP